jgi:lipid-A-disaccharide synthase
MHPGLSFVVPMPQSLTIGDYEAVAARHGYSAIPAFLTFVADEHEKFIAFQQACLALAKPGTVTLELGLLRVPTVVIFKTSWLSYLLGRLVVKVTHMSLPNLLTQQILCKELIQNVCTLENIVTEADAIVHQFLFKPGQYEQKLRSFEALDKVLCQSKTLC